MGYVYATPIPDPEYSDDDTGGMVVTDFVAVEGESKPEYDSEYMYVFVDPDFEL